MRRRHLLRTVRPRSLRGRLVWGAALLATVAVLAAQAIGFFVVRSWLLDRVDGQLRDFLLPDHAYSRTVGPGPVPSPAPGSVTLPSDFRVTFYDARGDEHGTLGGGSTPGPDLPSSIGRLGLSPGEPATVGSVSGDERWRVLVKSGSGRTSYVVALPLNTVDGAAAKMLWLNAIVLAATATGLVVLGRWAVRIGLLPLTRMEHTAQDITAHDLNLRLPDTDPRTETGRLSTVLNTMLDRLQRALRERESSEARLRRFVADAGHELRTPLTTIQGFAELALRHQDRPASARREADRLIAQNAERMSLLVDDLLLLAKLDQEPVYATERVDLLSLAADAVSAVAPQSPGHRIGLEPLGGGQGELEPAETTGDPHRLRQVVTNLLTNAVTHTPPRTTVRVRVGTARADTDSGGRDRPGRSASGPPLAEGTPICVVEVIDDGPGICPEAADRVFERLYRADPSRSRDQGGSGLGLAIASTIAQGHGGRLELETRPAQGCVFRCVLPCG
ncbi:sensor histidine kinase [Streptomyces sp. NPDC013157]|uniref:sensor histidine kinase n=1 Tax=Streptomyces sp. NPDC013157 TaxID=3364861 RepID=UPI0036A8B7E1